MWSPLASRLQYWPYMDPNIERGLDGRTRFGLVVHKLNEHIQKLLSQSTLVHFTDSSSYELFQLQAEDRP